MASHRLSTVYKQSKQANPVGYGGKPKADRDRPAADIETQQDTAGEQRQQLLRQFDLTAKFGPCTNITRRQRWDRANALGLQPPEEVRAILEQLEPGHEQQQGIWTDRT